MEVLVVEDTKEVEARFAVEDDGSVMSVKKKRRRRVSFAQTQTIHVIPRLDDMETPPLLDADPFSIKKNTPRPSSEAGSEKSMVSTAQPASPRVSGAGPDLPALNLHENSIDFGQFTCDMDTGHGSWVDEDFTNHRNSFNGLEDDSGCFVHLGHISRVEDDDSIVNDVMNDDMTMDATTFSRNFSEFLKSGTTFDLQGTGRLGQVSPHKNLNDSDSRSEDDSMALTKPSAPHWALINPQDVSMHADDGQSDMSIATGTERIRAKERRNPVAENKPSSSRAAEQMSPATSYSGRSTLLLDKQKENLAPQILRNGLSVKALTSSSDPHCDSDISMSLSNTMDISLHQTVSKRSDVLTRIDGNSQTPPVSRRRSDSSMQDTTFSACDFNTTVPVCNLKDLLSDHTDYTITQRNFREADLSTATTLDSHTSGSKNFKSMSGTKHGHSNSQRSDHEGLRSLPDDQEVTVSSRQKVSSVKAERNSQVSDAMQFKLADADVASAKPVSSLSDSSRSAPIVAVEQSNSQGPRSLEVFLHRLEVESFRGEDQAGEEDMVPLLPTKLQTLTDYLQFSCSVQPQVVWMSNHMQELEAKVQAAKKRNAEIKFSNTFFEMLPEDSTYVFRTKLANKLSLAKKGWLLWKMNPERQILALLQESKDDLIKEVEAVQGKGQQVLHLKELYSQIILKRKLSESSSDSGQAIVNLGTTSKEAAHTQNKERERRNFSQTIMLEKCHHHYQDACERLRVLKTKWNEIQTKIESIASVNGQKMQPATDNSDVSFGRNLEASIQRLSFTSSLLHQQQVMQLSPKSIGGKSLIDFSLEGMFSQRVQFEGDNPSAQVQISRTLHPKTIEMLFPCMDTLLFFQYINNDMHSAAPVQIQHVYRIIQRTNWLLGSLMDVLKELKYCRRKFRTSCKFQIQKDKLLLCMTFLHHTIGLRVTLMFDMVCVKGGGYPSDLKPAEVQIQTYGCPSNGSISRREVLSRIAKLQPGYGRLHRICSCVEELMRTVKENA